MTRYRGGRPRVLAHEHGTRSKYVTDKCRCEACTAANTAYNNGRYRTFPAHEQRLIREYVEGYDVEFTDGLLFGTKRCKDCGAEHPKCPPYFRRRPHAEDGLSGECRDCRAARERAQYAADPELRERRNAYSREYAARRGEAS